MFERSLMQIKKLVHDQAVMFVLSKSKLLHIHNHLWFLSFMGEVSTLPQIVGALVRRI